MTVTVTVTLTVTVPTRAEGRGEVIPAPLGSTERPWRAAPQLTRARSRAAAPGGLPHP